MSALTALLVRCRSSLVVGLAASLALSGLLAARSWLAAHDAAIHLAATLEVQGRLASQAEERQKQRDAALAPKLAQINAAKRRVNTPAKAVGAIPQALPPLPQPIVFDLPEPTPELQDPPAIATIPQADLVPIYNYIEDCRACELSLSAARDNLTDERAKLAAVTAERDAALRAVRGGSFWTRLRRNAKWFAIGAATATLAAARH